MKRFIIDPIPHKDQNYPSCGDWRGDPDGSIHIYVSQEMGDDSCFLVAVHELIEVYLLAKRGVTTKEVDRFDIAYEKAHREGGKLTGKRKKIDGVVDESEPGDDPKAPYFKEHQFATAVEQLVCTQLGISWAQHDKNVNKLP